MPSCTRPEERKGFVHELPIDFASVTMVARGSHPVPVNFAFGRVGRLSGSMFGSAFWFLTEASFVLPLSAELPVKRELNPQAIAFSKAPREMGGASGILRLTTCLLPPNKPGSLAPPWYAFCPVLSAMVRSLPNL